jgi:hypothetical protein
MCMDRVRILTVLEQCRGHILSFSKELCDLLAPILGF